MKRSSHHRQHQSIPEHSCTQTGAQPGDRCPRFGTEHLIRGTSRWCSRSEGRWNPPGSGSESRHRTPSTHSTSMIQTSAMSRLHYWSKFRHSGRVGNHTATEKSGSKCRQTCLGSDKCSHWCRRHMFHHLNTSYNHQYKHDTYEYVIKTNLKHTFIIKHSLIVLAFLVILSPTISVLLFCSRLFSTFLL